MKTTLRNTLMAAAVAAGFAAMPSFGATIASLIETGPLPAGAVNVIHDVDLEFLKVDTNSNGNLDPGDVVGGFVNFGQIITTSQIGLGIPSGGTNDELTGYFQVMVQSKEPTNIPGIFNFTFKPDPSFLGNGATGGAMAEIFTQGNGIGNGAPDANLTTTIDQTTANTETTNGAPFWILGFKDPTQASHDVAGNTVSNNGEGWVATGGDSFSFGGVNPGTQLGHVNFTVNLLSAGPQASGFIYLNQSLDLITRAVIGAPAGTTAQFIGSSAISGTRNTTGQFAADSSTDVTFAVATPLPPAVWSGLALMGAMGVGTLIRRRSQRSL